MLLHNKKGIFIPMFVVFTAIILGVLLFIAYDTEAKKNDLVGLRAGSILKAYDAIEKINLYLDLAAYYSNKEALVKLAENGGYAENNRCEKTQPSLLDRETYVILNTCPVLNPKIEFREQFKTELKSYISSYSSSYKKTDYEELFDLEEIREETGRVPPGVPPETGQIYNAPGDEYNKAYTENTRNANVLSFEDSNSKILVRISDITLPIENDQTATLTLQPKVSINSPDFSLYRMIYLSLQNNCSQKTQEECQNGLKTEFTDVNIVQEGQLIKVKLSSPQGTIKLALNPTQIIPYYQEVVEIA